MSARSVELSGRETGCGTTLPGQGKSLPRQSRVVAVHIQFFIGSRPACRLNAVSAWRGLIYMLD